MYVCMYIYIYIYIYTYIYKYTYTYLPSYKNADTRVHIRGRTQTKVFDSVCPYITHIHIRRRSTRIDIWQSKSYLGVFVLSTFWMCTQAYIHTDIHTYRQTAALELVSWGCMTIMIIYIHMHTNIHIHMHLFSGIRADLITYIHVHAHKHTYPHTPLQWNSSLGDR